MKQPTQCVLWNEPGRIDAPIREGFELLDTFFQESHQWRLNPA
jgi:hypothetical protein